jgi:alpha-acetolactate decarboxylase
VKPERQEADNDPAMKRRPTTNLCKHPAWLAAGLLALCAAAWAADPFGFTAWGSFERMMHLGDTRGQVPLSALPQGAGHWGVGALAGLQGEVLLHDGRLLVSRGSDPQGRTTAAQQADEAVLFAAARVQEWAEIAVPQDMAQPQFEAFVREQAAARGLDSEAPFPFLVKGRYPQLRWHVVTGAPPAGGGHGGHGGHSGHANKHAGMQVFGQPGAAGRLVGVYSGARLEGVVSHPGERFHVHYADDALSVSGHVDAYSVARGALLVLPVK